MQKIDELMGAIKHSSHFLFQFFLSVVFIDNINNDLNNKNILCLKQ